MKYTGPRVRLSRQLGIALTPKATKYMKRKPYPPGQHGPFPQSRSRGTDYKRQLIEKQKLRAQYNVHERQMRNYFKEAVRLKGNTGENLIWQLERRLDAAVYRAGLAPTIYAARQYVSHGHILVNGKKVNIASYQLREGDTIAVREKSHNIPCFVELQKAKYTPPAYLNLDKVAFSAKLLYIPERKEIPVICEEPLVVEFYAR